MSAPFSLDVIQVAAPCHASWGEMSGDERVRHCRDCQRNVYNLSEMTRADAEALLFKSEGRVCVRFYRRTDGTLLTADCPVGLWARASRRLAGVLAACVTLAGLAAYQLGLGRWAASRMTLGAGGMFQTVGKPMPIPGPFPGNPFPPTRGVVMGEVCPIAPAGTGTAPVETVDLTLEKPAQPAP